MSTAQYQMQAKSSADGALYSWLSASPDWAAAGYAGPGTALDVVVSGGGFDMLDVGVPDGAYVFDDGSYVVFDDGSYVV